MAEECKYIEAGFEIEYSGIVQALITDVEVSYKGRKYPAKALWDTGANRTIVCSGIIDNLEAEQIGTKRIESIGLDIEDAKVYKVDIILPNGVAVKDVPVLTADFEQQSFSVLIGFDIISQGRMIVDRVGYKTVFSFVMKHAVYDN